jgi:hypothetical protein
MSTLMVDFIISLDGYAAADDWPGFWGMEGPEYLDFISSRPENEHTTLMGATTYRLMSGFAAESPEGMASLTESPKVVFSSTLTAPLSWANTELVDGDPVETVVDRFRVVLFPVITGATGKERIFDGYPDIALDLVDHRTFDGRLQLLEYVPTVLDEPPGAG